MEDSKKQLLAEQTKKIEEIINVLQTQFGEDYEDEINYLSIVKDNLKWYQKNCIRNDYQRNKEPLSARAVLCL